MGVAKVYEAVPLAETVSDVVGKALGELSAALEEQIVADVKMRRIVKKLPDVNTPDAFIPLSLAVQRASQAKEAYDAEVERYKAINVFLKPKQKWQQRTQLLLAKGHMERTRLEEEEAREAHEARDKFSGLQGKVDQSVMDIHTVQKSLVLLVQMALDANKIDADKILLGGDEATLGKRFAEQIQPVIVALAEAAGRKLPEQLEVAENEIEPVAIAHLHRLERDNETLDSLVNAGT